MYIIGILPICQGSGGPCPPEADIFLFHRLISWQNYHINLGYLDNTTSVGARLHQQMMVRGSVGSWEHFLISEINFLKNYHINLGYLDYMASVEARLHQHIMVQGLVPLKLQTFSYFRN